MKADQKILLRPSETKVYEDCLDIVNDENAILFPKTLEEAKVTIAALEALSACRKIIRGNQWYERSNGTLICICCASIYIPSADESNYFQGNKIIALGKGKICKPDCAITAQLAGIGGK